MILFLVPFSRDISLSHLDDHFHIEAGISGHGRNVLIRVKYLDITVSSDVLGRNFTFALRLQVDGFRSGSVELDHHPFQVEDDLGDILLHPWNRGEFVKDTFYLHRNNSRPLKR